MSCKYLVTLTVSPGVTNNWTFNNFIILLFCNLHITERFDRGMQNYPKAIWIMRKTPWLLVLNTWQMLPVYPFLLSAAKLVIFLQMLKLHCTTYGFRTADKKGGMQSNTDMAHWQVILLSSQTLAILSSCQQATFQITSGSSMLYQEAGMSPSRCRYLARRTVLIFSTWVTAEQNTAVSPNNFFYELVCQMDMEFATEIATTNQIESFNHSVWLTSGGTDDFLFSLPFLQLLHPFLVFPCHWKCLDFSGIWLSSPPFLYLRDWKKWKKNPFSSSLYNVITECTWVDYPVIIL